MKNIAIRFLLIVELGIAISLILWFVIPEYGFWQGYDIPRDTALRSGDAEEARREFRSALRFLEDNGYTTGYGVWILPRTPTSDIGLWYKSQKMAILALDEVRLSEQSRITNFRRLAHIRQPALMVNTMEGWFVLLAALLVLYRFFTATLEKMRE